MASGGVSPLAKGKLPHVHVLGHLGASQAPPAPAHRGCIGRWSPARLRLQSSQPTPPQERSVADTCPFPPDLLQVEITKAYLAKQVDEITLQQADVVLILEQEDGEPARAGHGGWAGWH